MEQLAGYRWNGLLLSRVNVVGMYNTAILKVPRRINVETEKRETIKKKLVFTQKKMIS